MGWLMKITNGIKTIFVLFLLVSLWGCANQVDYYGNQINLHQTPISLKHVDRDQINKDIFYLTFLENNASDYGRLAIQKKKAFSNYMKIIMDQHGYVGYMVVDIIPDNLLIENRYIYEVRFTKSEAEFDKWNQRYKN